MFTVTMLGSGSRGNAILVDGSAGSLLVDAGFGVRTLAKRFDAAARRPEDVGALLLTHEHVDHACGAAAACDRWSWTVHASAATHTALAVQASGAPADVAVLGMSGQLSLCGFTVEHAPLPHDASDCRAFVLTDDASGARAGIVLDAGHVPEGLAAFLERLDLLVLESNHDEAMLANGPYPAPLKARIGGGQGHLSNRAASGLAAACAHRGLTQQQPHACILRSLLRLLLCLLLSCRRLLFCLRLCGRRLFLLPLRLLLCLLLGRRLLCV